MKLFKGYNRKTLLLKAKSEFPVGIFTSLNNFKLGKSLGVGELNQMNSLFVAVVVKNQILIALRVTSNLDHCRTSNPSSSHFIFWLFFPPVFSAKMHFCSHLVSPALEHSEVSPVLLENLQNWGFVWLAACSWKNTSAYAEGKKNRGAGWLPSPASSNSCFGMP